MELRVLVVDDEPEEAAAVVDLLKRRGFSAEVFALRRERRGACCKSARASGIELCAQLRGTHPEIPVVVLTGRQSIEAGVGALRASIEDRQRYAQAIRRSSR